MRACRRSVKPQALTGLVSLRSSSLPPSAPPALHTCFQPASPTPHLLLIDPFVAQHLRFWSPASALEAAPVLLSADMSRAAARLNPKRSNLDPKTDE